MLIVMAASSSPPTHGAHALDTAALLLVGNGTTPDELAERFAILETARRPAGAAALLARLARLGLVRLASTASEQAPRYVLSPLGQQYAARAFGGQPEVEAQLATLERLRTDLLSTIAHELRTPLTAVRTSVGLLRDPDVHPDAAAREQLLETIARSAERMQRLVADVLDLTRLRSGSLKLQARRFDAVALAREACAAIEPLLQARGQPLDLDLPKAPIWVYGDRRRLEQALLNLLSNAHRFAPAGAPIRLEVATDGGDVAWSVADRGPGIAPEDRARLFERFFTAASDSSEVGAGSGLGLPIAMAIAQVHSGTIEVASEPGRGSTFTLRMPARGPVEASEP